MLVGIPFFMAWMMVRIARVEFIKKPFRMTGILDKIKNKWSINF
jgi:FixJ family two-component response regulator